MIKPLFFIIVLYLITSDLSTASSTVASSESAALSIPAPLLATETMHFSILTTPHKEFPSFIVQLTQADLARIMSGEIYGPEHRDGHGMTDFMHLVSHNPRRISKVFFEHEKANRNAKSADGETAIFFAKNKKTINTLRRLGFSVNVKDKNGKTPLMSACESNDYENVEALLESGANVFIKDNFGRSAMHFTRNIRIMRLLQAAGLNINEQDFKGVTLLHTILSFPGNEQHIPTLLTDLGADKTLKDRRGYNPFESPECFYQEFGDSFVKRIPKTAFSCTIYFSISTQVEHSFSSLEGMFSDFYLPYETIGRTITAGILYKNNPGIAVDVFRIALLKVVYSRMLPNLSNLFFHKDLSDAFKTKRLWQTFRQNVNQFNKDINWDGVCPSEETIENQAVQALRNLIIPVEYLDDSYIKQRSSKVSSTTTFPISPEDLQFHSELTSTSAHILSTGGVWGINYNRVAKGTELKVMIDSAVNIGVLVAFDYSKTIPAPSMNVPLLASEVIPVDYRSSFDCAHDTQKKGHRIRVLKSLAEKLYTTEYNTNPYADKLTRHQTAAFFLSSKAAIEYLHQKDGWDDEDMNATILIANSRLSKTGRSLTVNREYMDDLLGKIYNRLGE